MSKHCVEFMPVFSDRVLPYLIAAVSREAKRHRRVRSNLGSDREPANTGDATMPLIKTRDGTEIYAKDWGDAGARPVILIHGYPLNSDSFDRTAMHLVKAGHRVINYDRRGFGRSGQPWQGYDWDTYSDDLADVMMATGATDGVSVIGYSMGGGECARYMSRHSGKGVVKIGLYASVVPGMLKSNDNPAGHTPSDYEDIVAGIEKDAAAFYRHTFLPPFYGKGIKSALGAAHAASDDVLEAAVNAALMGGMRAMTAMPHNFVFGDFEADVPAINVPTLILHGTEDKPAPINATARRAHKMIPGSRLIEYEGHPHGFYATNSDQMIADTLAFVQQ